eukprot:1195944-Prorocentrum_minimum.AAC.4
MTGVSSGGQRLMTFGTSRASEEGARSSHGPSGLTTDRQTDRQTSGMNLLPSRHESTSLGRESTSLGRESTSLGREFAFLET